MSAGGPATAVEQEGGTQNVEYRRSKEKSFHSFNSFHIFLVFQPFGEENLRKKIVHEFKNIPILLEI